MSKYLAISYEQAIEKLNKWHKSSSVLFFRSFGPNFGSMFEVRLKHLYPDRVIVEAEVKSRIVSSYAGFVSLSEAVGFEVDPKSGFAVDSLFIRYSQESYVALYELRPGVDEWPEFIFEN